MTVSTARTPTTITDAPLRPEIAVSDLERSKRWYADKLGWEPSEDLGEALRYKVGDALFGMYQSEFAGSAQNTVMNWSVDDVKATVARLRQRGLDFEEYDFGEARTVDGIMTDPSGFQNAWFKDPDGNIVGVISTTPAGTMPETGSEISTMLAASDIERAKRWYADKLDLRPAFEGEGGILTYRTGDSAFTVYRTEYAGTAKNTVAVWPIAVVRDEVARLRARGVEFEEYDFGEWGKTVDGVLEAEDEVLAWFKDSEGNILGLAQVRDGG